MNEIELSGEEWGRLLARSGMRSNACSASSSTTAELPCGMRKKPLITWGAAIFLSAFMAEMNPSTEPNIMAVCF
jgi:hypothetical protein